MIKSNKQQLKAAVVDELKAIKKDYKKKLIVLKNEQSKIISQYDDCLKAKIKK
ncbi:MAG: hypothetical protein AAB358_03585 [Patescibacteria group bacterium]